MENGGCRKFIFFGVVALALVILAFATGANAAGIILVWVAIASFGYGAGVVMNSPEVPHKD